MRIIIIKEHNNYSSYHKHNYCSLEYGVYQLCFEFVLLIYPSCLYEHYGQNNFLEELLSTVKMKMKSGSDYWNDKDIERSGNRNWGHIKMYSFQQMMDDKFEEIVHTYYNAADREFYFLNEINTLTGTVSQELYDKEYKKIHDFIRDNNEIPDDAKHYLYKKADRLYELNSFNTPSETQILTINDFVTNLILNQ